jgi:hypothetical protein
MIIIKDLIDEMPASNTKLDTELDEYLRCP